MTMAPTRWITDMDALARARMHMVASHTNTAARLFRVPYTEYSLLS